MNTKKEIHSVLKFHESNIHCSRSVHSTMSSVSFSQTRRSQIRSCTVQCFSPWRKSRPSLYRCSADNFCLRPVTVKHRSHDVLAAGIPRIHLMTRQSLGHLSTSVFQCVWMSSQTSWLPRWPQVDLLYLVAISVRDKPTKHRTWLSRARTWTWIQPFPHPRENPRKSTYSRGIRARFTPCKFSLYRRTHSLSRLAWSWVGGRLAPFYIHQMNRVNSRNGSAMMTAPQTLSWLLLLLLLPRYCRCQSFLIPWETRGKLWVYPHFYRTSARHYSWLRLADLC